MATNDNASDQPRLDPFGTTPDSTPEDASGIEKGGEGAGSPNVQPPDQPRRGDRQSADEAPMTQTDVLDGPPAGMEQDTVSQEQQANAPAEQQDAPEQEADESAESDTLPSLEEELGIDPADVPDHIDSAEKAAEYVSYYQRKAQQAERQAQEVQQQAGDLEALYPVLEVVQNDPELRQQVEEKLQEGAAGAQPQQAAANGMQPTGTQNGPMDPSEIERPTKPEKPEGFDRYEAQTDPESESAQYLEDLAEWQENIAEYNEQVAEAQRRQQQQRQQQMQQKRQQQQARKQLKQRAMYEQGFDEQQADEFIQWATSEESLNDMDAWAHAFRYVQGNAEQAPNRGTSPQTEADKSAASESQSAEQKRQQEMNQGPQNFPQSAAAQPDRSGGEQPVQPEQEIFQQQESNPDIFGDALA